MRSLLGFLLALSCSLALNAPVYAQSGKGTITGTVKDSGNSALQGALVELLPLGRKVVTDDHGQFRITDAVLPTPSVSLRPVLSRSRTPITRQTPLIPSFIFNRLCTLPSSVYCKSCVCRSYENCRGVCQQFPSWNSAPTGRRPHSLSLTPYPLSFHILAHSFALSCIPRKLNPFVFNRFRTLCQKPPGVGVPPLRLRQVPGASKERSFGLRSPLFLNVEFSTKI